MDAQTVVTVQGRCRKACTQAETAHVATEMGEAQQGARTSQACVWVPCQEAGTEWLPRRDGPANVEGVIRSTCVQGQSGGGVPRAWPEMGSEGGGLYSYTGPFYRGIPTHPTSSQVTLLFPLPPHMVFVLSSGPARAQSSYLAQRRGT